MPSQHRREPQPPELLSPWRTEARVALQRQARDFARDVVLPIADELDPQKGEMQRYWRDARLTTIFEGTSEIQRRIISDRMLPKG